jgi:Zn-finger nucleic acid-binding protein
VDEQICLGCGRVVDPIAAGGCRCPPPTVTPQAQDRGPSSYRGFERYGPCPRCSGALVLGRHHDVDLVECRHCQGLYLSKELVQRLDGPLGSSLRLAFPKRMAPPLSSPVRYIPCVSCGQLMNRQVFARISGVVVDVCKDHGVWFDAGEIAAVIAFIEAGGLSSALERAARARDDEKRELEKQFQSARGAALGEQMKQHARLFGTSGPMGWAGMNAELAALFR